MALMNTIKKTAGGVLAKQLRNVPGGGSLPGLFSKGAGQGVWQTPPQSATVAPVPVATGWDCICGHKGNAGKFCAECGKPKPENWDCECGHKSNTGKFCAECGKPKPENWDCECGHKGNTGKFCVDCGKQKPGIA